MTNRFLVQHAETELRRAGFFDADSDYGGMLGPAVLKAVAAWAAEGHSGSSHSIALHLFNEVVNFRPLGPLTSAPEEQGRRTEGGRVSHDLKHLTPEQHLAVIDRVSRHLAEEVDQGRRRLESGDLTPFSEGHLLGTAERSLEALGDDYDFVDEVIDDAESGRAA